MDYPSNELQINTNANMPLNAYDLINQNQNHNQFQFQNSYFNKNSQEINTMEIKLIQNMERIWRNEKFCKDLLKFDEEIISEIVEKIEQRVKKF
jgi:hypothetical protein